MFSEVMGYIPGRENTTAPRMAQPMAIAAMGPRKIPREKGPG